ncbi:hypothetical protein KXQ82_09100 [Mucilaginibacter sp. HMF5004]|uniref:hypothetical protein n=1 Tax=Mucilaginibacter rivuli TaxID=2857527 RepID=UPI001C5E7638|nr:hypothetical protein [Mucilaginibacter rivuli]MBW4889872.1 hypothetical protein [Mucilaginibacter rivuli]
MAFVTSCKTRNTVLTKTQTSNKSSIINLQKGDSTVIDTSQKHLKTNKREKVRDSAMIVIIPDNGIEQKIMITGNNNFNYTGQAKLIKYFSGSENERVRSESLSQTNGISVAKLKSDSSIYQKDVVTKVKTKATNTNGRNWIIALTVFLAIVSLLIYTARKFKLIT